MKKCTRCSKPATLHITELVQGNVQELHLCESCAHEYMTKADGGPSFEDEGDMLAGKLAKLTSEQDLSAIDELACPNCGISFREFRNQGRLGCPHDYIAFESELLPLLENIHGETQHTGKFPKRAADASQRQFRLIKLRNELRAAVSKEDYEAAARLRDEIQSLESELHSETP